MSSCKYGFLSVDWKRENSATDRLNERYGNSGMEYKGILVDVCHLETQEEMLNGIMDTQKARYFGLKENQE